MNTLDGASYTYDAAGNRLSKTNYLNAVTTNYGYDLIYELTQVTQGASTTESYSYDAVGNRLSSLGVPTYNYNVSNELTSNSNGSYSYDANGNTLSDAQARSFTWDFENRLTQVVNPGVGTTTFRYDPFGRRIQKSGPLGTTNYLYEGSNLLVELDSLGNVGAHYLDGQGYDQPLAELRSGTLNYYEQDGLSSVTSMSSSGGSVSNSYVYDSYGRLVSSAGTFVNSFQYTGRESDGESALYYYRARYYDPFTGRFRSEDPMGFLASVDFYIYVENSPTQMRDPFGLDAVTDDPNVRKCICQLWQQSGYGFNTTEAAADIVRGNDGSLSCRFWPFTNENRRQTRPRKWPLDGVVAIVHTHPRTGGVQYPSDPDDYQNSVDDYVVCAGGVFKAGKGCREKKDKKPCTSQPGGNDWQKEWCK